MMPALRHLLAALVVAVASMAVFTALAQAGGTLAGTITSVAPASGPTAGGTTVTITGTYLRYGTSSTGVTVGGVEATVVSFDTNQVVIVTPAGSAGAKDVVVKAVDYNNQTLATKTGGFTYVAPEPPFAITVVSPASGLTTGSEPVTITGKGFSGGTLPSVTMGGTAATAVVVVNDTTITAVTPAHVAGSVGVSVTRDGVEATKASAYTFNQGYWLSVKTTRPANIDRLGSSIGAVRTPAFGDWVSQTPGGPDGPSIYTGYTGGLNCGDRATAQSYVIPLFGRGYSNRWAGGPCRYAFPAGARVEVAGLPSASLWGLLPGETLDDEMGFVGAWRNACAGTTTPNCTVTMNADRVAGVAWGYARYLFAKLFAQVVSPTFDSDGALQYYAAAGIVSAPPVVSGGIPTYFFIARIPAAAANSAGQTSNAAAGKVVCRTTAHVTGRRFQARCKVTPALASALRSGRVRLTTTWSVRLPHARSQQPLRTGHITVSNRRAVVTG